MSSKEIKLSLDVALLPVIKMKAGNLSCLYEAGNLRYIKYGDVEIIRMIYGAVRDENWETIPAVLSDENIKESEKEFNIKYTAVYKKADIHYVADISIEGHSDSIVFSMKGEALSDFKKNRIGLCVHHPIKEFAGRNIIITEPGGNIYASVFPELISAHQPFLNIQKMNINLDNGIAFQMEFEGDIFETEDQRNWTDNSYKTYSTPLQLPFPAEVKAGEKIDQRITLRITGNARPQESYITGSINEEKILFPKIGYCRSAEQQPLTGEQIKLFSRVPFDHYRVELHLSKSSWKKNLSFAETEASLLKTKLELIIYFDDSYERYLDDFVLQVKPVKDFVSSILILHKDHEITPKALMNKGYAIIKQNFPAIETGYGTNGFFAGLNRNLPQQIPCDFVSFSVSPQVHAWDSRTLLENLASQSNIIKALKDSVGTKKIHVSPITLKMRKQADTNLPGELISIKDERQHTFFSVFWTLCCIQNFSEAGHITFYELMGDAGIVSGNGFSPVYDTLKMIKEFEAKWIIKTYENERLLMNQFVVENVMGDRLIFRCDIPASVKL